MNSFPFFSESTMDAPYPDPNLGVGSSEVEADDSIGAMLNFLRNSEGLRQALEETPGITQATPKLRVEIPPHPDEEIVRQFGAGEVWERLNAWAAYHRVDNDLALLVCACAAAHAAGPSLKFEDEGYNMLSAPTLIAASEERGFHQAVLCALDPLRQIQQELIGKYGEMANTLASARANESIEDIQRELARQTRLRYDIYHGTPSGRLNPEEQPDGAVRFLLEGRPPVKPHKFLEEYHLHAVVALLEIRRLPQTVKARENRLEAIESMVHGFRRGQVWIRGFLRLSRKDLEWALESTRYLRWVSLPVGGTEGSRPDAPARDEGGKLAFDRIHGVALREVLRLRFSREKLKPVAGFRDGEAAAHFGVLRETYLQEMYSVSHLAPMCRILPDLFVWYLLRLLKSSYAKADEMEVAAQAITAARIIRWKVAVIYDWHDALGIGRKRRALALKLVSRMQRLGGSCKRRELARGLDNQRMDMITPMIDLLIRHEVFSDTADGLSMRAQSAFEEIVLEAFMPPLEEVPFSATARLRIAEERQSAEGAPGEPVQMTDISITS